MAELQQYNTLAEAIAFNLTDNNFKELGLLDFNVTNSNQIIAGNNTFYFIPAKDVLYRNGLYDEIYITNKKYYDIKQAEFDTKDNLFSPDYHYNSPVMVGMIKTNSISRELDLNNNNTFSYPPNNSAVALSVLNGTTVGILIYTWPYKIPFFGNFFGDNAGGYSIYKSLKDPFIGKLGLRTKIAEDGSNYYAPITDFRYMPNKKVIKLSELKDKSFLDMLNLVPNNTIGFLFNNLNTSNVADDTLYEQFIVDIVNGQDIISSYEKLKEFETKYKQKYTIFFRTYNAIYFGNYDDCSIMAMFVNDNKLDYPLNENGYIDYKNIDYSKEYTSGLGAAKVNPKIITKMLGWSWTPAKVFTNEPDPDIPNQGVKTEISISNQIFRPSENKATLTVKLGHCIVSGITYKDKLETIHSKNKFINITDNKDGTYTIAFRSTINPQTDYVYIPVKNTFNGITVDNFYELELVRDNVTEVIRVRQPSYNVTISNCNTISGYLFYERKTPLADEEKNNLKQADIAKAFEFLSANIVSFPRLSPFDPIDIESITFSNREILCIFKGKALDITEQYRADKYHYDIQTINSKISTTLDITLLTDPDSGIVDPEKGNPPTNPPSGGGGGTGGGSGGGGGGPGIGNDEDDDDDDEEKKPKRDLNKKKKKEPVTPPDSSLKCNVPVTESDFANLSDYLEFVSIDTVSDTIYTDESLIGVGGEGDGSVTLAKNYQGGYVWTYPTTDDEGNRKLGTIYTNAPYLMPKITTTLTYRVKYRKESSKGDKIDANDDVYITFEFWQYAQSFVETDTISTTEGTKVEGGKNSKSFPNIKSIGKEKWDRYHPDNHEFSDDDFKYEIDGENVNLFMKWRFSGVGLESNMGVFSIKDVFDICIFMGKLTEDELRELYNVPESENIKITEAPAGSVLDENGFNIVFSTTNNENWLGYDFNFTDTSKKLVHGSFDFQVTLTDKNGLSYTKDFKNYNIRDKNKRYIYFYNNEIQTGDNKNFDVTNITNVKFEILEKRDFNGNVISPKEKANENT